MKTANCNGMFNASEDNEPVESLYDRCNNQQYRGNILILRKA